MSVLSNHFYRVGDIDIDESRACVRREGREHYLRPKAFQLLLFLLHHRNRIVSKDELIDGIWGRTAVTDDALVQVMKEVRKALGDDPRQPRFIKTFPKMGYRFIGPAEEQIADGTATLETREITTVEIEYERESADPIASAEIPGLPAGVPARMQPARTGIALIAGGVLILMLSVIAFVRLRRSAATDVILSPSPGRKPVAVMYFDNQSRDRDLEWLREGLADMLITDLSRSRKLAVLGRQQLYLMLERTGYDAAEPIRLDEALDIGRRSQAQTVIMGSFARLGEKIRVNVNLYDAGASREMASESLVADKPDDILRQIDLLSLKLTADLGVSSDGQTGSEALASVMTNNLEAYRYYSLALEKAQAYHTTDAIEMWRKAIVLDPQFAMAYARIGYTYTLIRPTETTKGKQYLQTAYQLSNRLTDKDKVSINAWYALAEGDRPEGIRLLREIVSRYPMEVDAYLRLGYQLHYLERPEEAIEVYKQALIIDPEARDIHNALGFACSALGRYDEAIGAHRTYVGLAPSETNAHDSLGMTYSEAGRYGEALSEFERALALDPSFHFALLHLGDIHFVTGQYKQALEQYHRFIAVAPSDWDRATGCHRLVLLSLKTGDLQSAKAASRLELKYKTDLGGGLLVALAAGDMAEAARSMDRLFGTSPETCPPQLSLKSALYLRGRYALKTGHADEAIGFFKNALAHPPLVWNVDGVEDCLADACLEAGRLDEAIAEYNRLLRIRPQYAPALFHLAQAYRQKGEPEAGRAAALRFLQAWKTADPDLPELILAKSY